MTSAAKRWAFIVLVVLQTVIFGFGNVLTKIAYSDITPLWCLVLRFSLAFAVFSVLFGRRIMRELRRVRVRAWLPAAVCMALSYIACNAALDLTTATNVGFLVALPVVFAPLLSSLVNRKRYPAVQQRRRVDFWHGRGAGAAVVHDAGRCACIWRARSGRA